MDTPSQPRPAPGHWAAAAVTLCGVCAFLELYCTQPLLPMLARLFHASKTGAGMTVSAATLGVAISAPVFGALTERLPRKQVIVASLIGISVPTLLAATSTSLAQLIFWRFLQGITVPGVIAVLITYIGEEWPPEQVALIMSFYVSGTALGGFMGRISAGMLADWFSWRVSFLALGGAALAGAAAVAAWLPADVLAALPAQHTERIALVPLPGAGTVSQSPPRGHICRGLQLAFFSGRRFTWITFHLAAKPFILSTTALSSLFFVYLIGLVVTPAAGYIITRVGLRAGVGGAICLRHRRRSPHPGSLAAGHHCGTGVAIIRRLHCANRQQHHLRVAAPAGARVTAAGHLYHLLLPGGNCRRRGSRSLLGARQVARLRGLHRRHAARRPRHRPDRLADARSLPSCSKFPLHEMGWLESMNPDRTA